MTGVKFSWFPLKFIFSFERFPGPLAFLRGPLVLFPFLDVRIHFFKTQTYINRSKYFFVGYFSGNMLAIGEGFSNQFFSANNS